VNLQGAEGKQDPGRLVRVFWWLVGSGGGRRERGDVTGLDDSACYVLRPRRGRSGFVKLGVLSLATLGDPSGVEA
jgi:hypothetical protein